MRKADLTPMHFKVVEMVGKGRTYREIAEHFNCSTTFVGKLCEDVKHHHGLSHMKTRDAAAAVFLTGLLYR